MPKVRVPQKGGEIIVSVAGDEPTTYKVGDDGTVTVKDADLSSFLGAVEGSTIAGSPSASKEK